MTLIVERAPPELVGHLQHRREVADAGVRARDVDAPVALERRVAGGHGRRAVGHVVGHRAGLEARVAQRAGRTLRAGHVDVAEHHRGALLGQPPRDRAADRARRPADVRHLACQEHGATVARGHSGIRSSAITYAWASSAAACARCARGRASRCATCPRARACPRPCSRRSSAARRRRPSRWPSASPTASASRCRSCCGSTRRRRARRARRRARHGRAATATAASCSRPTCPASARVVAGTSSSPAPRTGGAPLHQRRQPASLVVERGGRVTLALDGAEHALETGDSAIVRRRPPPPHLQRRPIARPSFLSVVTAGLRRPERP